jgi:DNA-binding transcriptional regulator YiaG
MYRYTESGLENVFLVNGYRHHQTQYGEGLSIADTDGLHKAIGRWLINSPKPLNGAELRFLRLEMEVTQRHPLRLWEKRRKKALPGSADRLLRAIFSEYVGSAGSVRRMLERLVELDKVKTVGRTDFRRGNMGWTPTSRQDPPRHRTQDHRRHSSRIGKSASSVPAIRLKI